MGRLTRLAVASAGATFLSIVLGGMARLTGISDGCGAAWPLCRGSILPPLELAPMVDYLHRTAAAAVGLLVLWVALVATVDRGRSAQTRILAWSAAAIVGGQLLIDAAAVRLGWPVWAGTVHLAAALGIFAVTLATAWSAALEAGAPAWFVGAIRSEAHRVQPKLAVVANVAALATLALILSGLPLGDAGGAVACSSWPLCLDSAGSASIAEGGGGAGMRFALLAIAVLVAMGIALAWRAPSTLTRVGTAMAAGFVSLQVGLIVADPGASWSGPLSLASLTLLWTILVAVGALAGGVASGVTLAPASGSAATNPALPQFGADGLVGSVGMAFSGVAQTMRDYFALTKPGILTLLLTTTLCAMLTAAAGVPPFGLVVATLVGGALAAGGANALNCFLDRDIDAIMPRTRHRATVAGRIGPAAALGFGLGLSLAAVAVLGIFVNWLAAALALAGNAFYVLVYTWWLKRRTPQNIVIGGAAGAVPPLVGWAAVTGDLSPVAWGLFAVVFFWTPPHFWALALLKQGEYGRAAVPMLPNVAGERVTRIQIVIYSFALAAVCLLLVPLGLGPVYAGAALVLNGVFVWYAVHLWLAPSKVAARRLFFWSLWYLALVFAAAVVDRMLLG